MDHQDEARWWSDNFSWWNARHRLWNADPSEFNTHCAQLSATVEKLTTTWSTSFVNDVLSLIIAFQPDFSTPVTSDVEKSEFVFALGDLRFDGRASTELRDVIRKSGDVTWAAGKPYGSDTGRYGLLTSLDPDPPISFVRRSANQRTSAEHANVTS